MVNLVIVSHSARLGEGVGELARQMIPDGGCRLAVAAGIDDPENPIGTDPLKVMAAIESVADAEQVLVMMDMGSALLSAETALELLEPAIAARVRLCAAPLVEGTLAATVSAAAGAGIDKVIADAMNALAAKRAQLGEPSGTALADENLQADEDSEARSVTVVVNNHNGLHVRPASRLVAALAGFDAKLILEKGGKCVAPDSINQIALLQVRCHDSLRLIASGPDADRALAAFTALASDNFGERLQASAVLAPGESGVTQVSGAALTWAPRPARPSLHTCSDLGRERQALQKAIVRTLADLNALAALAEEKYSADIAAIFSGHHTLLDDPELYDAACAIINEKRYCAAWAWHHVMTEMSQQYRQLDDAYLQARYIDIEDLLHRSMGHLLGITDAPLAITAPTILIAEDIFPSTVLSLDAQQVKGIALQAGSELSHGAIIARQAGIACLCGLGEALNSIRSGELIALDIQQHRVIRSSARA